jgi:hypothetical protein
MEDAAMASELAQTRVGDGIVDAAERLFSKHGLRRESEAPPRASLPRGDRESGIPLKSG